MSFLAEIKRRKIFQVAAVYAVVAWLLIQIVATVEEPLSLPGWFDTAIIVLLAVGFPIAIILAWAFDLTPQETRSAAHAQADSTPTQTTGQWLSYIRRWCCSRSDFWLWTSTFSMIRDAVILTQDLAGQLRKRLYVRR
jgi:hypothetical protein